MPFVYKPFPVHPKIFQYNNKKWSAKALNTLALHFYAERNKVFFISTMTFHPYLQAEAIP